MYSSYESSNSWAQAAPSSTVIRAGEESPMRGADVPALRWVELGSAATCQNGSVVRKGASHRSSIATCSLSSINCN